MQRSRPGKERQLARRWLIAVAIACLAGSLGCSLIGVTALAGSPRAPGLATRTPCPTFTPTVYRTPTPIADLAPPTPAPTETAPPSPTPAPTETATPGPTAPPATGTPPLPAPSAGAPAATATAAAPLAGWSFAGVQATADPSRQMVVVYGDIVNNTGAAQQLVYVTGTFFDDQGRVVAGQDAPYDDWPVDVVPAGGQVPFELTLYDVPAVAEFDLNVISESSSESPRLDFQFSDLTSAREGGEYCLSGRLRNPGSQLTDYLVVAAVLYNGRNKIVNFGSYEAPSPQEVLGDNALDFDICVDPLEQAVVRHEVRAWGW